MDANPGITGGMRDLLVKFKKRVSCGRRVNIFEKEQDWLKVTPIGRAKREEEGEKAKNVF